MHKRLGAYVLVVAAAQFVLYTAALLGGERVDWLFYVNPRIGLFLFETIIRRHEMYPGLLSWGSAVVLAGAGIALISSPKALKMYMWAEGVLAIPWLLFFLLVIGGNLSPAHGFSIAELIMPVPMFFVASVVPFRWGYRSRSRMTADAAGSANTTSAPTH